MTCPKCGEPLAWRGQTHEHDRPRRSPFLTNPAGNHTTVYRNARRSRSPLRSKQVRVVGASDLVITVGPIRRA